MFTPTAAATLTPPLDVDALGVEVPPDPRPGPATVSAWLRWSATWPLTPPGCSPAEPCAGAPAADAFALASDADAPSAWNDTVVPAATLRCVVDSTVWFAIVRPSETPIAALLPPVAAPAAVLIADAVSSVFASSF